ncbi:unnamed protein product [Nesidiocoris tenuis]|uniref:Uncharacterized protein n=1 Tax=Nesidiocoris tenuis TaxID=355587 RepID=A0A6H5G4Q9_9HEMI|nr:unnamed protein product [Nesidiocoris tenuis]
MSGTSVLKFADGGNGSSIVMIGMDDTESTIIWQLADQQRPQGFQNAQQVRFHSSVEPAVQQSCRSPRFARESSHTQCHQEMDIINLHHCNLVFQLNNVRSLSETRYNKSVDGKVITSSSRSVEQHAAMRPSPVHYRSNDSIPSSSLAVGKLAKTAANNHMLRVSNKLARPMEMVFSGSKRFDVRDVPANGPSSNRGSQDLLNRTADTTSNGTAHTTHIPTTQAHSYQLNGRQSPYAPGSSISTNERIRREVVGLPPRYPTQSPSMASSVVSISSVTSPDTGDEEKLTRDTETSEKLRSGVEEEAPNEEELWAGPGEAMALDDELAVANLADIDQSPAESMNPPLRSILLTIEDPTFATLAALSNAGLLEDETAPDSPDISCSSPSSVEPLPPPPANITSKTGSPHSPGTPTHASNSSSSDTKDRDFLIDDEIADQPGLVFGSTQRQNDEPSLLDRSRTINLTRNFLKNYMSKIFPPNSFTTNQQLYLIVMPLLQFEQRIAQDSAASTAQRSSHGNFGVDCPRRRDTGLSGQSPKNGGKKNYTRYTIQTWGWRIDVCPRSVRAGIRLTGLIHLLEMESEEKDLKIKKLEEAMRAINEARPPPPQRPADSPKFVNISTQTDRLFFRLEQSVGVSSHGHLVSDWLSAARSSKTVLCRSGAGKVTTKWRLRTS